MVTLPILADSGTSAGQSVSTNFQRRPAQGESLRGHRQVRTTGNHQIREGTNRSTKSLCEILLTRTPDIFIRRLMHTHMLSRDWIRGISYTSVFILFINNFTRSASSSFFHFPPFLNSDPTIRASAAENWWTFEMLTPEPTNTGNEQLLRTSRIGRHVSMNSISTSVKGLFVDRDRNDGDDWVAHTKHENRLI